MMKSRMLQPAMPEMSFEEEAGVQSLEIRPYLPLCARQREQRDTVQ